MTVSGNPASFVVRGAAAKVNSLTVPFSPIQSMNGYDHPWPAGGGKNKFDVSKMVNTSDITINNGVISVTGNAKNSTKKLSELADLAVGETHILTANTTGSENIIYLYGTGANVSWTFGTSKTITQEMLDALVMFYGGQNATSQITDVMIRLASVTDATYAPYSNICPISGRTGCEVYRTGKNLLATLEAANAVKYNGWGLEAADITSGISVTGMASGSGHCVGFLMGKVGKLAGQSVTLSCTMTSVGGSPRALLLLCDNAFGNRTNLAYIDSTGSATVTIPQGSGDRYIAVSLFSTTGSDSTSIVSSYTDIQLELGSTASTYEPYNGNTYAVDWTSPAGTVYGGTLDVVTGVLTVTMATIASYNGETIGEPWMSSMDAYASGTTPTTGAQVVYELATPLTYQLTPQEVELLFGLNNVWSDTDSVITVDYDVLSFIKQKFIVNGTDFSRFIERDSYQTSLSPVYGETVQTIDGVGHTARLRLKGALRLALNPQTDTDTAAICTELLNSPCEVIYHCLQRDADVAARMTIDTVSASFLSRCLYWGDEWNQIDPITLTEL